MADDPEDGELDIEFKPDEEPRAEYPTAEWVSGDEERRAWIVGWMLANSAPYQQADAWLKAAAKIEAYLKGDDTEASAEPTAKPKLKLAKG